MTSLLPEVECNVSRLKKKSQPHTAMGLKPWRSGTTHEEARSFLELSRENLNMQQQQSNGGSGNGTDASINCATDYFTAELLQQQSPSSSSSSSSLMLMSRRLRWLGLLSWAALGLALGCAILELWALRRILAHASDIAGLGRDVEVLKQRLLERDLLDELRAFEQQLYSSDVGGGDEPETSDETEHDSEQQLDGGSVDEYDLGYEDETPLPNSTTPNSSNQQKQHQEALVGETTTEANSSPCSTPELEKVLATLRRLGEERGGVVRNREAEVDQEDVSWRESQRFLENEQNEDGARVEENVVSSTSADGNDEIRMTQQRRERSVNSSRQSSRRTDHSPKTK